MTCKDCVYATQPTTTMRCRNHGIFMADNAVVCDGFKGKPQTNADRIRAMTDEELAEWLERIRQCCTTQSCRISSDWQCPFAEVCYSNAEMLDWLKQVPPPPNETSIL